MLLNPGTQASVIKQTTTQAGKFVQDVGIQTDAVLLGLVVTSITGTLDVNVYALVDGQQSLLLSFPQITAATTSVLLRRSPITTSTVRIVATYSGIVSYELHARAVGSGTSDVRILGPVSWSTSQLTVGTSAIVIIPISLVDRAGILIKNWSVGNTVYIAESLANATAGLGYPLAPRDALAMDIAAGAVVYAISDAAGADLRIVEAGS